MINKIKRLINIFTRSKLNYLENSFRTKVLVREIEKETVKENFNFFKEHFKNAMLFYSAKQIRKYSINKAIKYDIKGDCSYLEFGVYKGSSIKYFSEFVKKIYGFDSFKGIEKDFIGTFYDESYFKLNKIPKDLPQNVELVIGRIEDTLDQFLKKNNNKIIFAHIDVDNYGVTKIILKKIKPFLEKNAILLFDELFNYPGWRNNEFKALYEEFSEHEFVYKAFNLHHTQVCLQIK